MEIKTYDPQDQYIKALIYGPPKSGKTTFAGTAKNAVFASAEGGLLSIAHKRPEFKDIKSIADLTELYNFLKKGEHKYNTVVIDSITEINEIIKSDIEKKTGRTVKDEDWDELGKRIRKVLRNFRDLPMHVVFIAQERYFTNKEKIEKIAPSLNGKSAADIAYFMDVVGYPQLESDGRRWMQTEYNRKYFTGSRSSQINNQTPPDFEVWKELVLAESVKEGQETN